MPIYEMKGHLTGTIEGEAAIRDAQHYLQFMSDDDSEPANMEQYLDPPLNEVVEDLRWHLDSNGHDYRVVAFATRDLTQDELKKLGSEVSGQNSDGLGEGFEQQDFAEQDAECGECHGCENGFGCDEYGGMISFDWETNPHEFVRIK